MVSKLVLTLSNDKIGPTELHLCQIIKSSQNEWSLSQLKKWSQNLSWLFQMRKNGPTELQLFQIIKSGQNKWSLSQLKKWSQNLSWLFQMIKYGPTELQLCQIIKSGQNEWSLSQLVLTLSNNKKWTDRVTTMSNYNKPLQGMAPTSLRIAL